MFNTFFFGYLSLKWRRLFRTLFLLPYIPFSIVIFSKMIAELDDSGFNVASSLNSGLPLFFSPIFVATLSWVIKPFVTSEAKFNIGLYTIFFGYLPLKWRRLVRVLLLLIIISFQLSMLYIFILNNFAFAPSGIEFLLSFLIYPLIGLLSWVIKPFVIDEPTIQDGPSLGEH